jgi:hypothetical protein
MQYVPWVKRILNAMAKSNSKSEFAERIVWPIWLWLFLAMMVGSIYLTFWAPFGHLAAIIITAVITGLLIYSNSKFALEIVLINDWLYVGNAKIECKYLKKATPLNRADFLKLRGRDADPAAFYGTRFWVSTGVKIEINDKKDPTPYWLISSRKARLLASKLN